MSAGHKAAIVVIRCYVSFYFCLYHNFFIFEFILDEWNPSGSILSSSLNKIFIEFKNFNISNSLYNGFGSYFSGFIFLKNSDEFLVLLWIILFLHFIKFFISPQKCKLLSTSFPVINLGIRIILLAKSSFSICFSVYCWPSAIADNSKKYDSKNAPRKTTTFIDSFIREYSRMSIFSFSLPLSIFPVS